MTARFPYFGSNSITTFTVQQNIALAVNNRIANFDTGPCRGRLFHLVEDPQNEGTTREVLLPGLIYVPAEWQLSEKKAWQKAIEEGNIGMYALNLKNCTENKEQRVMPIFVREFNPTGDEEPTDSVTAEAFVAQEDEEEQEEEEEDEDEDEEEEEARRTTVNFPSESNELLLQWRNEKKSSLEIQRLLRSLFGIEKTASQICNRVRHLRKSKRIHSKRIHSRRVHSKRVHSKRVHSPPMPYTDESDKLLLDMREKNIPWIWVSKNLLSAVGFKRPVKQLQHRLLVLQKRMGPPKSNAAGLRGKFRDVGSFELPHPASCLFGSRFCGAIIYLDKRHQCLTFGSLNDWVNTIAATRKREVIQRGKLIRILEYTAPIPSATWIRAIALPDVDGLIEGMSKTFDKAPHCKFVDVIPLLQ